MSPSILVAAARRRFPLVALVLLLVSGAGVGVAAAKPSHRSPRSAGGAVQVQLTPSQPALAACMPGAALDVTVARTADQVGADRFTIQAKNLSPNRDYAVFLLESAGRPFGAAEYIGDLRANPAGNGQSVFQLIVEEAFASTNGMNRVDLNQIGVWFADPADDDFCAAATGVGSPTPFDGDGEAGVQAFNSANAAPLP
jgi:hypothetical protein